MNENRARAAVLGAALVLLCSGLASAAPSRPHGGKILVGYWGGLGETETWYTVNGDGSGRRELPSRNFAGGCAALSPTGRRIAFGDGWRNGFYIARADGSDIRRIAAIRPGTCSVDWAPDSRRVAFSTLKGIWTVDTSRKRGRARRIVRMIGAGSVVWSPRGHRIAFLRARRSDGVLTATHGIYVVRANGSALRRVAIARGSSDEPVSWSPDGRRLLFASRRRSDDLNPTLYSLDVKTRASRNLGEGFGPAWAPRGGRMAFMVWTEAGQPPAIEVARANGTGRRIVAGGFSPVWSPDGRQIVFADNAVTVMRSDGTGRRSIGRLEGDVVALDWAR